MFNKLPVTSKLSNMVHYLSTDVITKVYEKFANSLGFVYELCTRVHGHVDGNVRAVYNAVYGPYTRPLPGLYGS